MNTPLLSAQTPGGVSSSLRLWHNGETFNMATTGLTAPWADARGGGRPSSGFMGSISYETQDNINRRRTVRINDERFVTPLDISAGAYTEMNVFCAYKAQTGGEIELWGNGLATPAEGRQVTTNAISTGGASMNVYNAGGAVDERVYINQVYYHDGIVGAPNNSAVYVDGTAIQTNIATLESRGNPGAGTPTANAEMLIGISKTGTTPTFGTSDFDLGEIIVYAGSLTQAEQEKINTHLAIRYGKTLPHNYVLANDTVAWDRAGHNYNNHIIGLANDYGTGANDGALQQIISKSEEPGSDYLRIRTDNAAAYTAAGQRALLAGSNNQAVNAVTPINVGGYFGDGNRCNRIWRLEETGTFNQYAVALDDDIFNQIPNMTVETSVLLVSNDPNFDANSTIQAYRFGANGNFAEVTGLGFGSSVVYVTVASFDAALWVKADASDNVFAGAEVDVLADQLFRINDMTGRPVGGGTRPVVLNNVPLASRSTDLNFNPYIEFNQGTRNYVERSDFIGFGRRSNSIFMVIRNDGSSGGNNQEFISYNAAAGNSNDLNIGLPNNVNLQINNSGGYSSGQSANNDRPALITNVRGDNTNGFLRINGAGNNTTNHRRNDLLDPYGSLTIAQEQDSYGGSFAANQDMEGEMAELIILSNRVTPNSAERINSYLAVKYGITLGHNYRLSDGNITWNRGNNGPYNRRIAGIGRDDAFQLDQRKSRSQESGTDVMVESTTAFPTDLSCLIWGADNGDHNTVSTNNAPPSYEIMERVWKAQNYQDQVGAVTVIVDIPPVRAGNLLGAQLLVNTGNANFSANTFASYNMTSNTAGEMIFENVILSDDSYFTVGFSLDIAFVNQEPGSPPSFEACPGDLVRFNYKDLAAHPSAIRFRNTTGSTIDVTNINFISQQAVGGLHEGEIEFRIPFSATTGPLTLMDGGTVIFNSTAFIVIHNPEVDFVPQTSPVCANAVTPLLGFPSGGTFSGTGVVGTGTVGDPYAIDGTALGWSNNHDVSRTTSIDYDYFPEYTNGASCNYPTTRNKTIEVFDNRIDSVAYVFIVKNGNNNNITLDLTRSTFRFMQPDLRNNPFPHPYSFTGTYVTPQLEFLADITPDLANVITFRFNNNGCIGEVTDTLYVYEPLSIPGLPDTLCAAADSIPFYRDPSPINAYSSTTIGNPPFAAGSTVIRNEIVGTTTLNPANNSSISYTTTTPGSEVFMFDPNQLPPGTTEVIFNMEYRTTTTTYTPPVGGGAPSVSQSSFSFFAVDTVFITSRPNVDISQTVDTIYCKYDEPDTLRPSPAFEALSRTYFTVAGQDFFTNQYNLPDTLVEDSILIAGSIFDALIPANAQRNLPLRIIYTVDRYGCVDHDTAYSIIVAPLEPIFYADSAYCTNDDPDLLSTSLRPGSIIGAGTGRFLPLLGLDTTLGLFSPSVSGPGLFRATYVLTDLFGCESEYSDTLFVRTPPNIDLLLDNSAINDQFCGSDTAVAMRTQLLSGSVVDRIRYFGAGVIDSTLNPNSVFLDSISGIGAGTGGTSVVYAVALDSFGCRGVDSIVITILQAPGIEVDSAFNNEARLLTNNVRAGHSYCFNEPIFALFAEPYHVDAFDTIRGQYTGAGIITIGDSVFYNPRQAVEGGLDTIVYTYRDVNGCRNTDVTIIKIDTIPDTHLLGLNPSYCVNYDTVHLRGIPDRNVVGGTSAGYSGLGLNPTTGVFDPSRAGLGTQVLSYTFVDGFLCEGVDYDTIIINPLPTPLFGGYEPQYCTAAPDDTLVTQNYSAPPVTSYRFWGAAIIDSTGILRPDTSQGRFIDSVTGPQFIYYSYTDTNACSNVDSALIFIQPTPILSVDGLDSAYCFYEQNDRIAVSHSARIVAGSASNFGLSATTLIMDPDENSDGLKYFTLIYTDPTTTCADTLLSRTYVHRPQSPVDSNLVDFYCATRDTVMISGAPAGGTFTGPGIVTMASGSYGFIPDKAGTGFHDIIYSVSDTLLYSLASGGTDTLVCDADTLREVEVRPLPDPKVLLPTNNQSFCSNDSLQELIPAPTLDTTWHLFSDTSGGVVFIVNVISDTVVTGTGITITQSLDTTYYFDPSGPGSGTHSVTYTATNIFGCSASAEYFYTVNTFQPADITLDTVYCESAPAEQLFSAPQGGVFTRDGDTIFAQTGTLPVFIPNPGYASGQYLQNSIYDTVVYNVEYGACESTDTVIVHIYPVPQISYTTPFAHNTYCLGMPAIPLTPSDSGGTFSGNGVLFQTTEFRPDIAGAGYHLVSYDFTDSTTGCANRFEDTIYVYGMPNAQYSVVGGCQLDSANFVPDNQVLGLGNIFQNQEVDSITSVQWVFEPGVVVAGTSDSNRVDSIQYNYTNAGIYFTQLIVANQVHCIDTQTVRLVISPKINSYPYDETFENGPGNWFAEAATTSQNTLWQWGVDNSTTGITPDPSNNIWATALNQWYGASEAAWVYSPCFDLDSLDRPMISLDYWIDTRNKLDGAVIEYQKDDGTWAPLGEEDRGINWFDTDIISGRPGAQSIAPVGWSGQSNGWVNGRYKLDDYGGADSLVRLRIAFGSISLAPNSFYDGFAFDNVWIGNRTRNVLLETTSNIGQANMHLINNYVYDLIFHTSLNKDVIMIQYHTESPDQTDQFFLNTRNIANVRTLDYGSAEAGRGYIDGRFNAVSYSNSLTEEDFEQDMLQSPKFSIDIDMDHMSTTFTLTAIVTALEDMPFSDYRLYTTITEDSLMYFNTINYPSMLQAVVRADDGGMNIRSRSWLEGESDTLVLTWDHGSSSFINYQPGHFQGVAFMQDKRTEEVFQASTTRDISGYWIGIDPITVEDEYNEISNMLLFPNPTANYFNLRFDQPLSQDYQWKLVSIHGQEVKTGTAERGTELLTIDQLNYPAGTYILLLYNDNVFAQRKVVIRR